MKKLNWKELRDLRKLLGGQHYFSNICSKCGNPATPREEIGHIDFLQTGNLHCFGCHKDFPPDTHFDECEIKEKTPYGCEKCKSHSPAPDELKENREEDIAQKIIDRFFEKGAKVSKADYDYVKSQIKKAEERSKRAERERILAMVEKIIVGRGQYVSKLRELKALLTEK